MTDQELAPHRHVTASVPSADASVVVLDWPDEASHLAHLIDEGRPVLLLVGAEATPPATWDRMTDWIRLPADQADIQARVATLVRRAVRFPRTVLDRDGLVRRGRRWTALTPIEVRLFELLLACKGGVVRTDILRSAGWPVGERGDDAVARCIVGLRRRIEPLGLRIHTVARRGYLLEVNDLPY
jgi:DNA-binding response OmpR family regulator